MFHSLRVRLLLSLLLVVVVVVGSFVLLAVRANQADFLITDLLVNH